ncbi:hypothetical protein [Methylomonas sp. MgM2]
MAHIHGAKTAKAATEAMGSGAMKMMNGAMSDMGKMTEATHSVMKSAAAGAAASAGKTTIKKVLTHPATLIGFGIVLGYLAYKFRHDIVSEEPSSES